MSLNAYFTKVQGEKQGTFKQSGTPSDDTDQFDFGGTDEAAAPTKVRYMWFSAEEHPTEPDDLVIATGEDTPSHESETFDFLV